MRASGKTIVLIAGVGALLWAGEPAIADEDPLLSIPGYWEPVGESVDPGGILPPFGDDTIHRPAIAIHPETGEPVAVVHRHGVLNLVGLDDSGTLFRVHAPSGQTRSLSAIDALYESAQNLTFDTSSDTLYALDDVGWDSAFLLAVEPGTGQAYELGWIPSAGGLTYDRVNDTLLTATVFWDGDPPVSDVTIWRVNPVTGVAVSVATGPVPGPVVDQVFALAYDPETETLFAVLFGPENGFQLAAIDSYTAEVALADMIWGLDGDVRALAFDELADTLYGVLYPNGTLIRIDPGSGIMTPIGADLGPGIVGLTAVNRQQDCLTYVEFDGADWQNNAIDNEQDGLLVDMCLSYPLTDGSADCALGRIDGMSVVYPPLGAFGGPLVAWSQRVDDLYSEILVARRIYTGGGYAFEALGTDAFGVPSNRLPGISRTLRDSVDPVIVVDAQGRPIVAWRETLAPDQYEIYVLRYDPFEDQWLEMGAGSASGSGVSGSGGTAASFDLAVRNDQVVLVHPDHGELWLRVWDEVGETWPNEWNFYGGAEPSITAFPDHPLMLVTYVREGTRIFGEYFETRSHPEDSYFIHEAAALSHPTATLTPSGRLVAAWQEEQTTPWSQVLAKHWDGDLWTDIGIGSGSSGGLSGSPAPSSRPQMATDSQSRPVIAWEEDGQAFVRRFSPALEPLSDCNANGIEDVIDAWTGTSQDCTGNGYPDECEMFDLDYDGAVGSSDLERLVTKCLQGPSAEGVLPYYYCYRGDADCDDDVDLRDFAMLQNAFPVGG